MNCKACGEKIIFGKTVNNKWIPIDFDSLPDMDIRYLQTVDAEKYPIIYKHGVHVPHFATCLNKTKGLKNEERKSKPSRSS